MLQGLMTELAGLPGSLHQTELGPWMYSRESEKNWRAGRVGPRGRQFFSTRSSAAGQFLFRVPGAGLENLLR